MRVKNDENHIDVLSASQENPAVRFRRSDSSSASCCSAASIINQESENVSKEVDGTGTCVTASFSLEGMSCLSCARKIEKALSERPGVKKAQVNFARREAVVSLNKAEASTDDLRAAVEAVGYRLLEKQAENLEEAGVRSERLMGLRPYLIGVAAATGVVGFYLGLLTLTSDWYNARLEFREYGIWILTLAAGLGVQATLFSLYRAWHKGESMKAAKCTLAASGGMSTTAMAACCAHYLVAFLPALGLPFLSAAAASLAHYQTYFFLAGVLSSLFGIGLMLRMMYKSGMIQFSGLIGPLNFKFQQLK